MRLRRKHKRKKNIDLEQVQLIKQQGHLHNLGNYLAAIYRPFIKYYEDLKFTWNKFWEKEDEQV
jgi:hypothetical protein